MSTNKICAEWASYQICKIAACACVGNAGNISPRRQFQRKPLVSDPGMHHGTCVTHVSWCMSGSLTCSDGENVPGIPGACAPAILRIWQEAHTGTCYPGWFVRNAQCPLPLSFAIRMRLVIRQSNLPACLAEVQLDENTLWHLCHRTGEIDR